MACYALFMANLPRLIEELSKLEREQLSKQDREELRRLSFVVDALIDESEPQLTQEQLAELMDRSAAMDRGEGIRVDDVDAWIDGLNQ